MGEHTVADVPATRLRFRVAVAQMCWRFDIIALLRIIIIEWTDAENWIYSNAQCSIRPFAFSRTCVITIVLKIYDNSHLGSMCDINTKLQRALRKCVSRGLSSGSKTSDETCATVPTRHRKFGISLLCLINKSYSPVHLRIHYSELTHLVIKATTHFTSSIFIYRNPAFGGLLFIYSLMAQ